MLLIFFKANVKHALKLAGLKFSKTCYKFYWVLEKCPLGGRPKTEVANCTNLKNV